MALLAAGAAALAWRGERARRAQAESDAARLGAELDAARAAVETGARASRGRQDELVELRRKLEKARKRAFAAQEERGPLEARVKELEASVRGREEELARLRGRLDAFESARESADRETGRLREELARAEKAAAAALRVDPEEHALLRKRVDAAEDEVRRLGAALRAAEQEASRWRQRERVQRRAYTVLRGELDIAKDHLRVARGEGALEVDDGAEAGDADPAPHAPGDAR